LYVSPKYQRSFKTSLFQNGEGKTLSLSAKPMFVLFLKNLQLIYQEVVGDRDCLIDQSVSSEMPAQSGCQIYPSQLILQL
jgi:hypothetical protein